VNPDRASAAERVYLAMVASYQTAILNYLYRLVGDGDIAEELTQDTFVKAYRALGRLELGAEQEGMRRAWLYRIAQNTALDHLRRRAHLRWLSLEGLGRAETPRALQADPAERPAEQALVRRALAELDEGQRQILLLFNQEGLNADEVAEVLGISSMAARKRRQRANEAFRQQYHALAGDPPLVQDPALPQPSESGL